MIRQAEELVKPGEKAIAVFTRGDQFSFDQQGDGKTGNWKVNPKRLEGCDKVIIYKRCSSADDNRVYICDYMGVKPSPEPDRFIIFFTKLVDAGRSSSNWVQFGGGSGGAFFYIR